MEQILSAWRLKIACASFIILTLLSTLLPSKSVYAITASIGQPYRGHLVNAVPFPRQFRGYQLRDEAYCYATPELVGAVLDSIEKVLGKYPDSCDLYVGDMSASQGGRLRHHRSHENGRDIDLGMYTKGNQALSGFAPMNEENLDAAKTWDLIENFLRSRRVQYIFLDSSIQKPLYRYALSQGLDQAYLDKLFGCAGNQDAHTVIQHLRGHRDHIHIRFYAPWSTLAGQLASLTEKQRGIIELAQGAYLPKKVNYYVQGNEPGIAALATSFGVSTKDLCRWNQVRSNEVLTPGSSLVFYKRGFEVEPVRLAQSLQPNAGAGIPLAAVPRSASAPPIRLAALQSDQSEAMVDIPTALADPPRDERRSTAKPKITTQSVRKGETLAAIAKKNRMDVDTLCRLNGLKKNARLNPGQKLKVSAADNKHSTEGAKSRSASAHQYVKSKGKAAQAAQSKNAAAKPGNKTAAGNTGKKAATAVKATAGKQPDKSKGKVTQAAASKNAPVRSDKKATTTKPDKKTVAGKTVTKAVDSKKQPVPGKQPEKAKIAVAPNQAPAGKPAVKAAAKPDKKAPTAASGRKAPKTAAASTAANQKSKKSI
jgi:LysM repeat protein